MKLKKINLPDFKSKISKVKNLRKVNFKDALINRVKRINKENIKAYQAEKKARREKILEKRRNGKLATFFKPINKLIEKYSLAYHGILSCVIYYIMEAISRHSLVAAWRYMVGTPITFLYNAFMIFISFTVVYLVRRRLFTRIIISVLWLVLGISNGYMLMKRVTPFNAQDLKVMGDGLTLINSYFSGLEMVLVIIGIVAVIVWLIAMWRRGNQYTGKMRRGLMTVACIVWFGIFSILTDLALDNRVVSNYFGNIAFAYEDYGLPYCFVSSIFNTGISEPHNYSEETMLEITNDGKMSTESSIEGEKPNIIFVQLESFFDPYEVEFLELSSDPIPYFRNLASEYSSGYFKVPSIGAGTANTEFEVITGMNMRFFGPGEYPHKTILKEGPAESAAVALAELGYGAHVLHNNGGNFYSRANVFNNLGFDSYTSKEFMNVLQVNAQGWAKDNILTEHILNAMDTTEGPDYVMTIAVEGHGSYPEDYVMENPTIEVTNLQDEPGKKNSWEYFVNLCYEMDKFTQELIEAVNQRGEPSVIVFYGDHLPTLGIESEDVTSRYLYNTTYVIWDNLGLEQKNQNLASYQVTAEVFEQLGIKAGTVFNYHQERRKSTNYLVDLEMIQYDLLYGNQYAYKDNQILDEAGHMQMGNRDVEIIGIVEQLNGTYSIIGQYFTNWSHIYVNGEKQTRKFLNNTRIDLTKTEFEEGDTLVICQVGSSETIFRTSATYEYTDGTLVKIQEVNLGPSWEVAPIVEIEEAEQVDIEDTENPEEVLNTEEIEETEE